MPFDVVRRTRRIFLIVGSVIIGGIVLVLVLCVVGWSLDARKVSRIATRFQPGMTVEQFVAALPRESFFADISVPERVRPCKAKTGQILPVESYAGLWPEMPDGDTEGDTLSDQARQIPMQLPRMESLDKHLRDRGEWKILLQVWSVYLEDLENPGPIPYLRRGTIYLALDDFDHAYPDLKRACNLRSNEACLQVEKLPPEKVTAFEAEQQHIASTAPACEPKLNSYELSAASSFHAEVKDKPFRLRVVGANQDEILSGQFISTAELTDLLTREYKGREWMVRFRIDGDWDVWRSYFFDLTVDREGKLEFTTKTIQVWDR